MTKQKQIYRVKETGLKLLSLSLLLNMSCRPTNSIAIPDAVLPTQENADSEPVPVDQYQGSNPQTGETNIPATPAADPGNSPATPAPPAPVPKPVQTIADGRYYIKGIGSGRCLDIPQSNTNSGIQLQIWDCNQSGAQLWTISYTSDDYYKITNYYGKSIEVRDGAIFASNAIQTADYSSQTYQQFKFSKKDDGSYVITIRGSALAVDVSGAATASGTKIQVWQETYIGSQKWVLIPVP